jgi:DNA-binding transcriptional ArsR family regulator
MVVKNQDKQPGWHLAKQALSHSERSKMLAQITQVGVGVDAAELAEALGMTLAKVNYHLLVLYKADLIAPTDDVDDRYVAVMGT